MERDTEMAVAHGADGVVFGILDGGRPGGHRADAAASGASSASREAVFHRAFDVTPDPFRALDELVDLGITRILTSGQCDTVWEGLPLIARLVEYAGDRVQIMPGGGIKPYQFDEVIAKTGCRQIHVAAWKAQRDDSTRHRPEVTFGGALYPPEDRYDVTDRAVVADLARRGRI